MGSKINLDPHLAQIRSFGNLGFQDSVDFFNKRWNSSSQSQTFISQHQGPSAAIAQPLRAKGHHDRASERRPNVSLRLSPRFFLYASSTC
jgi:hypothetical protein